jgi:hypothetical protein
LKRIFGPQRQLTKAKRLLSKCYSTSFGLERYLLSAGKGGEKMKNKIANSFRGLTSLTCKIFLSTVIISSFAILIFSLNTYAQCKPGDMLVGEDDNNWYCRPSMTLEELQEMARDLYNYIVTEGPSEELLGDEWRYRKAMIEATKDLAKRKYALGAKVRLDIKGRTHEICVAKECEKQSNVIDCSGYTDYAGTSACFVKAYSTATCGRLIKGLQNNANSQLQFFKENNVFLTSNGNPKPGDLMFLEKTYMLENGTYPIGASHVAIYLGKRSNGQIRIMHAGKSTVGSINLPSAWYDKILGYGNISKLIIKLGE